MFTKKKPFYKRKLFYAVIAVLLVFGYWISPLAYQKTAEDANIGTKMDVPTDNKKRDTAKENEPTSEGGIYAHGAETGGLEGVTEGLSGAGQEDPAAYYLVKEVEGVIKVYHCDAAGNESLLYNTGIAYSLISEQDQEMFSQGVTLFTEEELLNLLQDFES